MYFHVMFHSEIHGNTSAIDENLYYTMRSATKFLAGTIFVMVYKFILF